MQPDWAAIAIALLALGFTIGSFWWLHARLGRVRVAGEPRSFALTFDGTRLLLTLPFVFINDGPTPIVIVNLRLKEAASGFSGTFVATHDTVYGDKGRAFATGFVVGGSEARLLICEFQGPRTSGLAVGPMSFVVEGLERRLRGRAEWRPLGEFDLRIDERVLTQKGSLLAYDNEPS